MKRYTALLLVAVVALLAFAACGGGSDVSASQPAQTSSSVSQSQPASSSRPVAGSVSPSSEVAPGMDLDAIAAQLAEAANLGTTISMPEMIDLQLSGVDTDNIVGMAGLASHVFSNNGGVVVVIQAAPGAAATVAADMEGYRDASLGNADYEEFEDARTNTQNARIKTFGDYVVYAVSATGHQGGWDALDAAIDAAFA